MELAIVVAVSVCVAENVTVLDVTTDALRDNVVEALEVAAEPLGEGIVVTLSVLIDTEVTIVDEGVAYGGRFRSGVPVGQPSVHDSTNFAPRTWLAYIGGIVIASLM